MSLYGFFQTVMPGTKNDRPVIPSMLFGILVTLRSLFSFRSLSIIWNRPILQLAVQSLTWAFCSWPSCRGSVDWLVIWEMLLERWCHLLLFAWCLHSGCLLWWFFLFLWRSCWSSLENSTSLPFLQDSRLAVSGYVPAASISSQLWWSTVALFLWFYTVCCWISPFSPYTVSLDITFLSCFLWKLFSFLWLSFDTPQVPQFYDSTLFTSVSYSRILVVSFVSHFFFQIASFFAWAIVANPFLLWMSSKSPSFDPSFITFLHSISSCLVVH